MISVIADDFTGAAELAGISLRYGLKVELCVDKVEYKNADVLIVSTDSRSLNKDEAVTVTGRMLEQIIQLKPEWIYKKIDSVLRGYVLDELKDQMRLMDKTRAFIMPANPLLVRTIENGEYFINGIKINETDFVDDPEFPIKTASVRELLNNEVEVIRWKNKLPATGLLVGEVSKFEDYSYWIDKINEETVLAGAGDFYNALLSKYYQPKPQEQFEMQTPHLYVCGTAFKERKELIKKLDCVSYLPDVISTEWFKKAGDIIRKQQKAVIAIDESTEQASVLRNKMANAIKQIIERESVNEIFIEGGSTAAAVLTELNITFLEPVNELERGVVRMKAGDLFITVKPGSYALPKEIKRLYRLDK
jgi:uncharacterized protein YgbK (DUF1537 family)